MIHILLEIFKKYTFQQKRILLVLAVGLAVSGLGMRSFVSGDLAAIQKNKTLLAKAVQRNAALTQTVFLATVAQKYQEALSRSRENSWMMEAVHRSASEAGFSVLSVSPQNSEKKDVFEKMSLSVEGDGSYKQIGKFVELMENHNPWIFLDTLRLEKATPPGFSRRLKAYLILSAYHEPSGGVK